MKRFRKIELAFAAKVKRRIVIPVGFTEEQEIWMKQESAKEGLPISVFIRRFIILAMTRKEKLK